MIRQCNDTELEMYLKFRQHIDRLFFPKYSEEGIMIGAYDGDKQVGFMFVVNGYIEGIWVEEEYRRKGYAKQMVNDYIKQYCMPDRLHILVNNPVAHKFWNSIFELKPIEETNIDVLYRIVGMAK